MPERPTKFVTIRITTELYDKLLDGGIELPGTHSVRLTPRWDGTHDLYFTQVRRA